MDFRLTCLTRTKTLKYGVNRKLKRCVNSILNSILCALCFVCCVLQRVHDIQDPLL